EAWLEPLAIAPEGTAWEAEAGWVRAPMERSEQDGVGYVWEPGEPGQRGGSAGATVYRLRLPAAGTWQLWGRVQAPTPDDDSFSVRLSAGELEPLPLSTWALGVRPSWTWVPFGAAGRPQLLELPAGVAELQVVVRENGTRLERLWLGSSESEPPH
ncbi:MAG: hypothetical protein HUU35_02885, partial [Armatimonadetes bacterium]|nr:hypothetical protein [Armatimonadota bacterium]